MRGRRLGVAAFAVLLALALPTAAGAAIPVNTTVDENNGGCPTSCSLRDAVTAANGTSEIVTVPAGTYSLPLGALTLNGVTIQGAGAGLTIISGVTTNVLTAASGTNAVSGVTITGGVADPTGAGILIGGQQLPATLVLDASTVAGNEIDATQARGAGIAVYSPGTLRMTNSTVSGNRAEAGDGDATGGGVYVGPAARAELRNSTVSGNASVYDPGVSEGGGIGTEDSGVLVLENVTVSNNTAESGAGIAQVGSGIATATIRNSIVAGNNGAECRAPLVHTGERNLTDDATCSFSLVANPLLGPLQVNTGLGRTATHALPLGSPAINAGDAATCLTTDQRAAPRPAGACDIGAFEYTLPRLTVTTQVVNDDGLSSDAGDFTAHVRQGGADVAGSPQPGSATGTTYTLGAGAYTVAADARSGYAISLGGACGPDGSVAVAENEAKTCTIVADDRPPRRGETVNVKPVRGTVRIKLRGRKRFRVLREGQPIPVGSTINTLKGRVEITAAGDQAAVFYAGIFRLQQTKRRRPLTTLKLVERLRCPSAGTASIAAKRKKKRRLWGDGKGRFRTQGEYSSATVRGTKWLVEDRCTSTLTRVVRGRVAVRDFAKKRTVIVRAKKRYVARQP
jgi:CSLREA domain-containing protein